MYTIELNNNLNAFIKRYYPKATRLVFGDTYLEIFYLNSNNYETNKVINYKSLNNAIELLAL